MAWIPCHRLELSDCRRSKKQGSGNWPGLLANCWPWLAERRCHPEQKRCAKASAPGTNSAPRPLFPRPSRPGKGSEFSQQVGRSSSFDDRPHPTSTTILNHPHPTPTTASKFRIASHHHSASQLTCATINLCISLFGIKQGLSQPALAFIRKSPSSTSFHHSFINHCSTNTSYDRKVFALSTTSQNPKTREINHLLSAEPLLPPNLLAWPSTKFSPPT